MLWPSASRGATPAAEIAQRRHFRPVETSRLPRHKSWSQLVEAMGIEPTDLLHAMQALYQLSYAPRWARAE